MMTKLEHTPGTLRAAEVIALLPFGAKTTEELADIIDRETTAAELLEACKLIAAGPVDEPQIDLTGDYEKGLYCGLEDIGLQNDGYGACRHGFEAGVERVLEWAQGIAQDAM